MSSVTPIAVAEQAEERRIDRRLVAVMAAASGLAVANQYYVQPILPLIAKDFGVGTAQAGIVATVTQLGYALGLLLIVPLGDTHNRRRLIVATLLAVMAALAAVALAPSLVWLAVASFAVGVLTVSPQVIVPFASSLAGSREGGRVVGTVMSGLLIGILLARTASGLVGAALGWRAIFWIAAGMMVLLALALRLALPDDPARAGLRYGQLLASMWQMLRTMPALREAAAFGALVFGCFSAFWVTLAFHLQTPSYHYGSDVAGLFGLVGVAGAMAATFAGRLSDRMPARRITGIGIALVLVSFGVFWLLGDQLWGLALGVILLDLGVQGAHISNQTRVYALNPAARSRLNSAYIVIYFLGGSLGSALASAAWASLGWAGVCALGGGFAALALLIWLAGVRRFGR
ncbi:MFS transporter [Chloroflexia bacterium SDU3-3]|nr:MFS transporter [Chloroflexia bacterium SDU3-3]